MNIILEPQVLWIMVGIAIVLMAVLIITALILMVVILNRIKEVLTVVKRETELIAEDVDHLRDRVKSEGFKLWHLFRFLKSIFKKSKR